MKLEVEQIKQVVEKCGYDGHTIYKAEAFNFLPEEILNKVVIEYESDGSGKGDIFDNNGNIISKVRGIYGLNLLYHVANNMNIDTSEADGYMGRGRQADALTQAINKKIKEMENA